MIASDATVPAEEPITMAFIGDSITAAAPWVQWFPEAATVSLGAPGSTTDDVLELVDDVIAVHPDEIYVLIGTNDLGSNRSVELIVRNIQLLLVELRREIPHARMLLQSIMPRAAQHAENARVANIHLWQFASTVHAQYLDLWPTLADEDGALRAEYSEGARYLNDAGYQAWLAQLRPAVEELREEPCQSMPMNRA